MIQNLVQTLAPEFALDLGTANTCLYIPGRGVVANEASFIALKEDGFRTSKVVAFGARAKELKGRTSSRIESLSPLEGGAIKDLELTERVLRYFFDKLPSQSRLLKARVVVGVSSGATEMEQRTLIEAVSSAGAGKVYIVEEVMAAAIGAGIPVEESRGTMIVDIGGGTTAVAVVSLNGVVVSQSIKSAGNYFDQLICERVKKRYGVIIGDQSAESLKLSIGSALAGADNPWKIVHGQSLATGMPTDVRVFQSDLVEVLAEPLREVARLIQLILDRTPPEVAGDLMESGVVLVGGGALLPEIDTFLSLETGLDFSIAEDPMTSVVIGAGKILEDWGKYKHLLTSLQSQKQRR